MELRGRQLKDAIDSEIVRRTVAAVIAGAHITFARRRITGSLQIKWVIFRDIILVHALPEDNHD